MESGTSSSTVQLSSTAQPSSSEQPSSTAQPSSAAQPSSEAQSSSSAQPSRDEAPTKKPGRKPVPKPTSQPRPKERPDTAFRKCGEDFGVFASSTLQLSLWKQYQSGKYTDLTVTCGDRTFQVHKVVVCAQSSFFEAACGGRFKESAESKIDLPDEDPDLVERFFQFLYLGNYVDGEYFHELPSLPSLVDPERVQTDVEAKPDLFMFGQYADSESDGDYDPKKDSETIKEQAEPLNYDSDRTHGSEISDSLASDSSENSYHEDCPVELFTSLRMYILGDKYDVPALHLLAKKRFIQTADIHWRTYEGFLDVLDELFVTTVPSDPLRWYVCYLMEYDYVFGPSIKVKLQPIVAKHADLSLKLLECLSMRLNGFWRVDRLCRI